MPQIITVSREFGSGGRELGVKLADALGIPFYDKELISMAADDINIAEEAFRYYDEHIEVRDPLDRQFYHAFSEIYQVPMSDQIFVAQSNVIRRLASHGPCVIVGRCADYALADYPNHLSLFISAPLEVRIQRVAQRQNLTPEKARQLILKTDKRRASYYEYYSSKKWGSVDSYHFCIDSSYLGLGRTVELIQTMVAHKEHPIPSPTEEDPTRPRT